MHLQRMNGCSDKHSSLTLLPDFIQRQNNVSAKIKQIFPSLAVAKHIILCFWPFLTTCHYIRLCKAHTAGISLINCQYYKVYTQSPKFTSTYASSQFKLPASDLAPRLNVRTVLPAVNPESGCILAANNKTASCHFVPGLDSDRRHKSRPWKSPNLGSESRPRGTQEGPLWRRDKRR